MNLTSDIESKNTLIKITIEAIKACEYATQYSLEALGKMDMVQADFAAPYLKKIDDCNGIIKFAANQALFKERTIKDHDAKLRAATSTVRESSEEFAAICGNTDVLGFKKTIKWCQKYK